MAKNRYIEKDTGKWWCHCGFSVFNGTKVIHIREWENDEGRCTDIEESDFNERFEYKPFENPSIKIEPVIPRHPIHIVLRCPVCDSDLKLKGGALLSSPLQYENVCSDKNCTYGGIRTRSYYSGMYAAVTDEQEAAIANGTYEEREHGKIIQLSEKDLWKF